MSQGVVNRGKKLRPLLRYKHALHGLPNVQLLKSSEVHELFREHRNLILCEIEFLEDAKAHD